MIYDKIDNWQTYAGVSENIRIGLEFLRSVKSDIENGVHELTPSVRAIVSEYKTKTENENGYEAHREYIDIQFLISGSEKLNCLPLEYMVQTKAYNEEKDTAFYVEDAVEPQELLLGNGYFAILYPQDGHKPNLSVDAPMKVKKVVLKIKCSSVKNKQCYG